MSSPVRDAPAAIPAIMPSRITQRAVDDLVGKHDAGIAQNRLGGHFRQSFFLRRGPEARDSG